MQRKTKFWIAAASGIGLVSLAAGLAAADPQGMMGHGMGMGMMGRDFMGRHKGMNYMLRQAENFAERYDANKDGKITQDEINQNRQQWLADADTSKDGKLDLQEFQSLWVRAHHERMVREFQKLDRDGDGTVTQEEYTKPMGEIVAMFDVNGDGILSRDDITAFRERMMNKGRHPGMMEGGGRHDRMMQDQDDNGGGDDEGSGDSDGANTP